MSTSYPTGLDSYTTKTDAVDDVLAAHVNNLQDAIVAVETKLGLGAKYTVNAGASGADTEQIRFNRTDDTNRYNSIYSLSSTGGLATISFRVHDAVTATSQITVMTLMGAGRVGIMMSPTYTLDVTGNIRCSTGFGCNGTTPQTAYASGGALASYTTGAFGLDSDAHMSALHALVVKIRAALVANGIMS